MKDARPDSDVIALVESRRMMTGRPWHPERLFFLLSAARHFAAEARERGFTVRCVPAATTVEGLRLIRSEFGELPIVSAEPSSHRQATALSDFGVTFTVNDFFLTTRHDFGLWASRQKSFVMENFYRAQRIRLGILVSEGKPEGGRWNFDADNRLPPPKNYEWPPSLEHTRDEIDGDVQTELGHSATRVWATTRAGALNQLAHFMDNHLDGFGPYEDAVSLDNWSMHHSLLSPYLNNGLLHPDEVVTAALSAYRQGRARIESVEAFVRQVIGWREYINGMYWFLGPDYKESNKLNAQRPLPPLFSDSTRTDMVCVRGVVSDVEQRAWTHHVPRLMVLSNLALLTGTNPQEFLNWMREQFIDAAEWVMVPNIIGMATHADGGVLMTKPYAAGGAYVNRMTEYCSGCRFDPKKRVGDDACPFTTLYWDFLNRHRETFASNHRMAQQLSGLNRLDDLTEIQARALVVLEGISEGSL